MAQFAEPDDEHQHAGEVMIELGVGDACDGSFPSRLITASRSMMFVVGADLLPGPMTDHVHHAAPIEVRLTGADRPE